MTYEEKIMAKLAWASVVQQQRALKKLAGARRKKEKERGANGVSDMANAFDHRRKVQLSREARVLHLYRAFLKGVPYNEVEATLKPTTIDPFKVCNDYWNVVANLHWNAMMDWIEKDYVY